ncbi:MAG: phosphate/phosphite/phosphonate ABC transporter substrate-binding protein [Geminicoccaceae bacterium]
MPALVALPMYDLPGLHPVTDAWWQGIAGHLRREGFDDLPAQLERERALDELWGDPDLLIAQTCLVPYFLGSARYTQVVGMPCYAATGCKGPWISARIVVRTDLRARSLHDLRGLILAINALESYTGAYALALAVQIISNQVPYFAGYRLSGSHRASLGMVADGEVDAAAIDPVTLALLTDAELPELKRLRVLTPTVPAPSLPFITSGHRSEDEVAALRRALKAAASDPDLAALRTRLRLKRVKAPHDLAFAQVEKRIRQADLSVLGGPLPDAQD